MRTTLQASVLRMTPSQPSFLSGAPNYLIKTVLFVHLRFTALTLNARNFAFFE